MEDSPAFVRWSNKPFPMLPHYVLLDLETTGATPLRDRITEIALIRYRDGQEVERWQTLVNPQCQIPEFIQALTGIDMAMVQDAPTFEQVAKELLLRLDDAVLCAHNVRFDYGFLKAEFKRIGIIFQRKVLCTVKLSRALYPEFTSHSLSALIQRYQLQCSQRHRAMGDVEVMAQFIDYAQQNLGQLALQQAVAAMSKHSALPVGLDAAIVDEIPDSSGVYLFFGENNLPLYIGKSVNLRARVLSHFQSDHRSTKEMRISQEIKHIEWIETAGEFGALLLESKLIKLRQPIYNRQLRRERQLCAWQFQPAQQNDAPSSRLSLVREDEINAQNPGQLFGTFRSKKQAIEVLRWLAEKHQLCLKAIGLESGKGACFAHQIKRCKGVCCGKESPEIHALRLQQALISLRLKSWPYPGKIAIQEVHPHTLKTQLHIFEQWCHLGSVEDEHALHEIQSSVHTLSFDLDSYKLLNKQLNKPNVQIRLL